MSGPIRTPRPRRLVASALLLTAAAAAAGAMAPAVVAAPRAVAAAVTASASNPSAITWSAGPATAQGPDHRAKFVYYSVVPGSIIKDRVAVLNESGGTEAFSVYGTDSTGTTGNSVLTWLRYGLKPKDIGTWEQFQLGTQIQPQLSVIIGGRRGLVVPFTITVPSYATPGDHVGAIMAQVQLPQKAGKQSTITTFNRIAVPIELRVKGAYRVGLQVQSVSTSFNNSVNPVGNGAAVVSYTVANSGNVRIAGAATVTVTGPFGMKGVAKPAVGVVLPGDSVRYTAVIHGLYPAGPMTAHVSVTPSWPAGEIPVNQPLVATAATASLFAIPWAALGVLALLVAAGFGAWYLLRYRRRQRASEVTEAIDRARRETERRLAGSGAKAGSAAKAASGAKAAGSGPASGSGDAASADGAGTEGNGADGGGTAG